MRVAKYVVAGFCVLTPCILVDMYRDSEERAASIFRIHLRGPFQKFCTLYVFSLKMNLFYKIHLQAFNVISIVLYHSGPMFGQVFYSCQDAFVVDVSDYSGHLIRHLLNASEAFPTEWVFRNKSKSGEFSPPDFDLFPKLKKPLRGKSFKSIEEVSNEVT
jgi:hypothetical protein